MEIAKVEIEAIEKVAVAAPAKDVTLLTELQLTMVGGGTGDIQLG